MSKNNVFTGEEEIEHWKNIFESQKEQRNRKRKGKDFKKGGKRGSYKVRHYDLIKSKLVAKY